MPDLHLPTPPPESWRPELHGAARASAWLAFIAPPKPMPDAPVLTMDHGELVEAIAGHLDVMDADPPEDTPAHRLRWFRR